MRAAARWVLAAAARADVWAPVPLVPAHALDGRRFTGTLDDDAAAQSRRVPAPRARAS